MSEPTSVLYWDASALLSLVFTDLHSDIALSCRHRSGTVHLLSSLAYTETCAVISRLSTSGTLQPAQADQARRSFLAPPWRHTNALPAREIVPSLARRWPLRGADLWHLACALTLLDALPELQLLSFDKRLHEAALGEGLAWMQDSPAMG